MSVGTVGSNSKMDILGSSPIFIANGFSADFCQTEYKKSFKIDKLPAQVPTKKGVILDSLLKYGNEWKTSFYELRRDIFQSDGFKRDMAIQYSKYSAYSEEAYNTKFNKLIEAYNNIIDVKIQELATFQTDCKAHLTPDQQAVVDEERKRLEDLKLKPKNIHTRSATTIQLVPKKPAISKSPKTNQNSITSNSDFWRGAGQNIVGAGKGTAEAIGWVLGVGALLVTGGASQSFSH
jgi:hypothetical protein